MNIIETKYKSIKGLVERKETTHIILHCSATPENKNYTVEQIHQMHLKREFTCIGYNFYIDLNGDIYEGRGEKYQGAHCTNHNSKSIGICYCGGCDKDMKAKDTRTDNQKESLFELVEYLLKKYHLTINDVHCHNEYAAKACPSFKIEQFRNDYFRWKDKRYEKYLAEKNKTNFDIGYCFKG